MKDPNPDPKGIWRAERICPRWVSWYWSVKLWFGWKPKGGWPKIPERVIIPVRFK